MGGAHEEWAAPTGDGGDGVSDSAGANRDEEERGGGVARLPSLGACGARATAAGVDGGGGGG